MARFTLFAVLGLVLAVAACTHAARVPSDPMTMFEELPRSVLDFQDDAESGMVAEVPADDDSFMIKDMLSQNMYSDLEATLAQHANDEDDSNKGRRKWPIQIVTKYFIKPDKHVDFIHAWRRYHAKTDKALGKGIIHNGLSKVAGDNIVWVSYTVYRDIQAIFEHMRSKALRDFGVFLMKENIAIDYHLVFNIGGCHCHKDSNDECSCWEHDDTAAAAADLGTDNKQNKKPTWPIRLATKFIVPPSLSREFVEEWSRLADKVHGCKGNLAFLLNKPADDNTLFIGYSAWKSHAAFWEAAKASRDFIRFIEDKNIVAVTKKLWRVPDHKPKA